MTTTVLAIYNAAISAARGKGRLTSLAEPSRERTECDIWYDQIRTQVLEAAYWPSTRQSARLTLLKQRDFAVDWAPGDPETEFLYSYALPGTYLRAWHLVNYEQFTLSFDAANNRVVLNTNVEKAVLVYSADQTNPAYWTPGLRLAVIYGLAASIVGATKGDGALTQLNYQLANQAILSGRQNVGNLLHDQKEVLPPALAARGYSLNGETRYYYPYGELFSGALPNG